VQRGNVPVSNRLLASRVSGDALDGKINFDKALGIVLCHRSFVEERSSRSNFKDGLMAHVVVLDFYDWLPIQLRRVLD